MFNQDEVNKKSFSEICEEGGAEPGMIKQQMLEFIEIVTDEGGWSQYQDGLTEAKMRYILECMENNESFTFEMLEFMQETILQNLLDDPNGPLRIPSLEGESLAVRALAGIAMNIINEAECQKLDICEENNGPYDFEPVIVYMTVKSGKDGREMEDYQTYAFPIVADDGVDAKTAIRETLVRCYAKLGEPMVVSLVSDTYMREVERGSQSDMEKVDLGADFLNRVDSDVYQGLACITYGFDEPFITATANYKYNDFGVPEFFGHAFDVVDFDSISQDKSDRGTIAIEIRNFFLNIRSAQFN